MIHSMTAFSRCNAQTSRGSFTWEIRSVNHRYFDCFMKLPDGFKFLEIELREKLRHAVSRGRLECVLQYSAVGAETGSLLTLNTALVQELARACEKIGEYMPAAKFINPLQVLGWQGVLRSSAENMEDLQETVLALFMQAINELNTNRAREGAALAKLLQDKLIEMQGRIAEIKGRLPYVLEAQSAKLRAKLMEFKTILDEARLEQEMVYFAQRIDINEEIERLETHIAEIGKTLTASGAVGKRLDFLLQECNRETNTIASKSVDVQVSSTAINMKVIIEQIREQVQNIE